LVQVLVIRVLAIEHC